MSADKKEYRAALEAINGLRSPSQFYEKLNKLFSTSEDQSFRKLLGEVMKVLRDAHQSFAAKKQANHKVVLNFRTEPYLSLVKYCQQQLTAVKPKWQILAERNGWQPRGKA